MSYTSDLVRDSQLETRFHSKCVSHKHYDASLRPGERPVLRVEVWKREKFIGGGAYGKVWLENCSKGGRIHTSRAVKEIGHARNARERVNFSRELEAMAKFSHQKYVRCFVESFGWYESADALFIAMEFFPQGDLQKYLSISPPLAELEAQQISFQLVEGLAFMHENGFAHRDLKPSNILVKSRPPEPWWVKIGDFGISKRAEDGAAFSSTLKGTLAYMAPELHGFVNALDCFLNDVQAASRASDMWSLGEITFQMLTKESSFRNMAMVYAFVQQPKLFPSDALRQHLVSDLGIAFIQDLMKPQPNQRMRVQEALVHTWTNSWRSSSPKPPSVISVESSDESDEILDPNLVVASDASGRWSTVSFEEMPLVASNSYYVSKSSTMTGSAGQFEQLESLGRFSGSTQAINSFAGKSGPSRPANITMNDTGPRLPKDQAQKRTLRLNRDITTFHKPQMHTEIPKTSLEYLTHGGNETTVQSRKSPILRPHPRDDSRDPDHNVAASAEDIEIDAFEEPLYHKLDPIPDPLTKPEAEPELVREPVEEKEPEEPWDFGLSSKEKKTKKKEMQALGIVFDAFDQPIYPDPEAEAQSLSMTSSMDTVTHVPAFAVPHLSDSIPHVSTSLSPSSTHGNLKSTPLIEDTRFRTDIAKGQDSRSIEESIRVLDGQSGVNASGTPEFDQTAELLEPSATLQCLYSAYRAKDPTQILYPHGFTAPDARLNASAPASRRFRYNRDFLLQFQDVFREKPLDWDSRLRKVYNERADSPRTNTTISVPTVTRRPLDHPSNFRSSLSSVVHSSPSMFGALNEDHEHSGNDLTILHHSKRQEKGVGKKPSNETSPASGSTMPQNSGTGSVFIAKEVEPYLGHLVLDIPQTKSFLDSIFFPRPTGKDETTHSRYTAVTDVPSSFRNGTYILRPNLFVQPRRIRLVLAVNSDVLPQANNLATFLGDLFDAMSYLEGVNIESPGIDWKSMAVVVVLREMDDKVINLFASLGLATRWPQEGNDRMSVFYRSEQPNSHEYYDDGLRYPLRFKGKQVVARIYEYSTKMTFSRISIPGKEVHELTKRSSGGPVQLILCRIEPERFTNTEYWVDAIARTLQPTLCIRYELDKKIPRLKYKSIFETWKNQAPGAHEPPKTVFHQSSRLNKYKPENWMKSS